MLVCGLIVAYSYLMEMFIAFYSGDQFEIAMTLNRMRGPYAPVYWAVILCNVVIPQALWFAQVRGSPLSLFAIAIVINIGMWLERFMIVESSLAHDFLPSAWRPFIPTQWDWAMLAGSVGLFALLFLAFVRVLPAISIFEMREIVEEEKEKKEEGR